MIGEVVGNFRVVRQLGKGGMGEVWLAEQREIKTQVAIKVLLPHVSEDKQQVQRFFNEAVAVAKIKHAGIAKIFDVGFHSRGEAYLVMEFLEGEPLSSRIERSGRLSLAHLCDVGKQIASVLEATHAAAITHRDLKPDNVFLVADAELASGERVKILDFGIAKLSTGTSNMTRTGAGAMGTPTYMSPEQWKSTATVDGRADIYSLGCLLFEMACGRPPFMAESIGEMCTMHLAQQPPSARALVPELPQAFDDLIAQLLAKQPEQRPTLRQVRSALNAMGDEKFSVVAPTMAAPQVTVRPEPSAAPVATGKPTTLGASAFEIAGEPPKRPRSKAPLAAGIALVAAAAAGVAFVVTRPHDQAAPAVATPAPLPPAPAPAAPSTAPVPAAQPAPATTPPVTAATTRIHIRTEPADAEVRIDGALVDNPFEGSFPRNDVSHRIDVRAKGREPESRLIVFDADHDFDFKLVPVTARPTTHGAAKPVTPAAPAIATKAPAPATATATTTAATTAGSAATTTAPGPNSPTTYKGTKGKLITTYPPSP